MKKLPLAALALILLPLSFDASAGDQGLFYVAGGASPRGANISIGAGTDTDVLEVSSIRLGAATGDSSAKFVGLSLVQNAVPVNKFNLMFRLGVGKETTSFANGAYASRMGFRHGIIVGVGGQYELSDHFALRGEVNRIEFATAADDVSTKIAYPVTLSALYIF
jgi:hypothetical protein